MSSAKPKEASKVSRRNNPSHDPAVGNEGQVEDGESRIEVNLRNGTRHDLGLVNGTVLFFKGIYAGRPDLFNALLALARSQEPTALPETLRELKRAGVVAKDGSIRPFFRDVLLSSVRETPEGIVVSSPFAPVTDAEANIVREASKATDESFMQFARKIASGRDPGDDVPGR